ncbi:hypothetical protein [Streptomyces scopuliridis]|uniref:hypothetical protein n=1 Tax=Streptomyces scopuliridis TaxID=452529 RepID=UPI0035E0B086
MPSPARTRRRAAAALVPYLLHGCCGSPGSPDSLEAALDLMAGDYMDRARSHGLNVTADRYGPGTHSWPYWERALTRALPMLTAAIGAR